MKNELFICDCNNIEHQLVFSCDPFDDKEDLMVFVNVHLIPNVWYKRIWNAIKYIFGYRCMYGYFDEFVFKSEDADRLQEVVNILKKQ